MSRFRVPFPFVKSRLAVSNRPRDPAHAVRRKRPRPFGGHPDCPYWAPCSSFGKAPLSSLVIALRSAGEASRKLINLGLLTVVGFPNIELLDKNGRRVGCWCFRPEGTLPPPLALFEVEALKVAYKVPALDWFLDSEQRVDGLAGLSLTCNYSN